MKDVEVRELIQILRESGNDTYRIEAKDASSGMPGSIDETLSAFANMPEGGLILLGIAENSGAFDVTGVWDPKSAVEGLGSKARTKIVPPIQLGAVETHQIANKTVVSCVVPPQPNRFKPFKVGNYGPAYTRSADGDYRLSPQEEQYLIGAGKQPRHDREPVEGADIDKDLDADLLEQYLEEYLGGATRLRKASRDEQLLRSNVIADEDGTPTVAAVYALGVHPQQHLPHLSIKVHAQPGNDAPPEIRMIDGQQFYGPVPDLLDQSFDWVRKQLRTAVFFEDGHGRDLPELPAVAIRELIANAIVHRDLSSASFGTYIQVVKAPSKLIVTSPGGLWGITQRQLGKTSPHARNPVLYAMCSAIKTNDGKRVIEGHATGIPATRQALAEAFLPEPYFKDQVIQFQAILSSTSILSADQLQWLGSIPGANVLSMAQKHALVKMKSGLSLSNSSYRESFSMDSVQARNELQELVQFGLAETVGTGRATVYRLRGEGHKPTQRKTTAADRPTESKRQDTDANTERQVSQPARTDYLTLEEKTRRVLSALSSAADPLPRSELLKETGLSPGQLAPTLTKLLHEGTIVQTERSTSRFQRYTLA